jgi:hypothetical protein
MLVNDEISAHLTFTWCYSRRNFLFYKKLYSLLCLIYTLPIVFLVTESSQQFNFHKELQDGVLSKYSSIHGHQTLTLHPYSHALAYQF